MSRSGHPMKLKWVKLRSRLLAVALVVGFLLFWERVGTLDALIVSRPAAIGKEFIQWFANPALRTNIPVSLEEAGFAFCGSLFLAILFASILTASKGLAAIVAPYITMWLAVPKIALAPVFIFIFGIGITGKVYFVALATFITPFFSIYRGLTSVDQVTLAHAKVIGATRLLLIKDVYIPSVLGSTLAVLRVTTQFCLLASVISELIAASKGIGYELNIALTSADSAILISGVLLVSLIAFALDRIVRLIEKRFLVWRVTT